MLSKLNTCVIWGFGTMLNYIGVKLRQVIPGTNIGFGAMLDYIGIKQSESKQKRDTGFGTVLDYTGFLFLLYAAQFWYNVKLHRCQTSLQFPLIAFAF